MITLTNEYQYIGRSNAVRAYDSYFYFYLLLYAKTAEDTTTGKHRVTVKMRLACTANSSFYNWQTSGSVAVAGVSAFAWNNQQNPSRYWGDSPSLTEDGVTYRRWVDLKEGTVEVDTGFQESEIDISAYWQRLPINSTPPYWLPSTTKALADLTVLLPEIERYEPEGPEEPEAVTYVGTRVYADDALVYDSRMEEYDLRKLKATTGFNVGGTAEITMPSGHPAYNYFVGHKTVVSIYRGNVLRFRGRALYPETNFLGQRTIICEGELCFLRDAINRPYSYNSTPQKIFRAIVRDYNAQVEPFKQFEIGTVTIPDEDVSMKNENAETMLTTIEKLVDRCGGYIYFTNTPNGGRAINWLATLNRRSGQVIELGENLLDFSSTGANNGTLATGLIPYGARDEKTKKRITIESVNDGKDYILAEDVKAYRGTIMATVTWDDVTTPEALLKKAQAHLKELKSFITSLELTALDLSYLDKNLDSFAVGDIVRVISTPHGVNDDFQLIQMTEDFLNPAQSQIRLGKDIPSLTGATVAGDFNSQKALESTSAGLQLDSQLSAGLIATQTENNVLLKVAALYAPKQTTEEKLTELTTADENLQTAINNEVDARAGIINKVDGVVCVGGGAPVRILGGKVEIDGTEIHLGKELRFLNESGIRIADKDGNFYYVLRVDGSNNCFVGNDYCNLYLRAKDAVYLHKTGAAVTSDRRHKNSVEALPEAYERMLDKLEPVRFRYNNHGDRYHVGFIAQDVEQALTDAGLTRSDFGGLVDVTGDGTNLGLAYDEFIGLLLHKIRKLEKRIEALEE